jgi:hypothetical protein
MRRELENALNIEERKKNVNDSKFRAVAQRMDYNGFRNMVLGANLKSVKAGEYQTIGENRSNTIFNTGFNGMSSGEAVAPELTSEFIAGLQTTPQVNSLEFKIEF